MRLVPLNTSKPSNDFLLTSPRWCFFCRSFLLFIFQVPWAGLQCVIVVFPDLTHLLFCLYNAVLSVPCILVITWWVRAYLLAVLCMMFSCVFATFPYGVLGQVWYLIVSFPDFLLLLCLHVFSFVIPNGFCIYVECTIMSC